MKYVNRLALMCVVLIASSANAQESKDFETSGFVMTGDSTLTPKLDESSNAKMYTTKLTRYTIEGPVSDDVTKAFIELSQTVMPMPAGDESLAALKATVLTGAQADVLRSGLITEIGEITQCVRIISGIERTGQQFDMIIRSGDDEAIDDADITGRIECYSFVTPENKGVMVTLKLRSMDDDESRYDELLATELLESLVVIPIDQHTPYVYWLAGYPLSLPIGSQLTDLTRANEQIITGNISMYDLNGNIQLAMIPENYSLSDTISDLKSNYRAGLIEQQKQGNLSIVWIGNSMFPAGNQSAARNDFQVAPLILKDGGHLYSQQHVIVDGPYIFAITLNGTVAGTQNLHNYAKAFYAKSTSDFGRRIPHFTTYYAPGFDLKLPTGYRNFTTYRDGLLHSMLISSSYSADSKELLDNAIERKAYTQIQFFLADSGMNLESAHRAVCQQVRDQHQDREQFPDDELFDTESMERTIEMPDGTQMGAIWNYFVPKDNENNDFELGLEYENINVTSVMIPVDNGHTMAVVSSISNELMHVDALATTAQIIDWLEPTTTIGDIEQGFGILKINPWVVKAYSSSETWENSHTTQMTIGKDLVVIKTMQIEQDDRSRSAQNLAKIFLKPAYRGSVYEDEYGLYPTDSSELAKISIAGHEGKMFEAMLTVPEEKALWARRVDSNLRVYGFRHGDQYTTITMSQESDIDSDRFDKYAEMFVPRD
ncbi:MAG: hypothetical protein JKX70_00805 [Phycisphaerales bacterium]|nr:hypothetical protein [Phycisphaerales bacterium]